MGCDRRSPLCRRCIDPRTGLQSAGRERSAEEGGNKSHGTFDVVALSGLALVLRVIDVQAVNRPHTQQPNEAQYCGRLPRPFARSEPPPNHTRNEPVERFSLPLRSHIALSHRLPHTKNRMRDRRRMAVGPTSHAHTSPSHPLDRVRWHCTTEQGRGVAWCIRCRRRRPAPSNAARSKSKR
jgi:hypothetical protein